LEKLKVGNHFPETLIKVLNR